MAERTTLAETWNLVPFEHIGPLRFGMARDQVLELLGPATEVMGEEPTLEERHGDYALRTIYDPELRLLAVQAEPWRHIAFRDSPLTGRQVQEVAAELNAAGLETQWDEAEDTLVVPALGAKLYAPLKTTAFPPSSVQGVYAVRSDYAAVVASLPEE